MDFQKRSYRTIFIVATLILGAALAFGLYWTQIKKAPKVTVAANPVTFSSWKTLLATLNPAATDDRSDAAGTDNEYKIFSIQSPDLVEKQLGTIRANIFANVFGYNEGSVYFVNGEGVLSTYNLATQKTDTVAIPDIKPVFGFLDEHSVYDFTFVDRTHLVYLQGPCTDGGACSLKEYDLTTKQSINIVDKLDKKYLIIGETTLRIQAFDSPSNSLFLVKTRNTARNGYADLIAVSLTTHENKVVKTAEFTADQKNTEASQIFAKFFMCGDVRVDQAPQDGGMQTTADAHITKKVYPSTYAVGCVIPK